VVYPGIAIDRRQQPGGHPDADGNHEREADQRQCGGKTPDQLVDDPRLVVERFPQIALHDPGEPLPVADGQGAIQAELLPEVRDLLRGSLAAEHDERRIAGNDVHQGEGGDGQREQHRDEGDQAGTDRAKKRWHGRP
jgi:hypothetical protein